MLLSKMNIEVLQKSFSSLFPDKTIPQLSLRFSGKFKAYNGNVSIHKQFGRVTKLEFSLSKEFKDCEVDMQIGIIHYLLNKAYGTNITSLEQDLYHSFIKNLTRYAKRVDSDSLLLEVFEKINDEYFQGLLERPNLIFGRDSTTVLGHYNYNTDTVTISTILKKETDLLDFVMYHELLHKKHGFKHSGTRGQYHTREFRADEKKFKIKDIDKKLERFVAKKKLKKALFDW